MSYICTGRVTGQGLPKEISLQQAPAPRKSPRAGPLHLLITVRGRLPSKRPPMAGVGGSSDLGLISFSVTNCKWRQAATEREAGGVGGGGHRGVQSRETAESESVSCTR